MKALLLLLLFSPSLQAMDMIGEEIGVEIVDTCNSEQRALQGDPASSVRYGLCLGYLKGVADALNGTTFCLPSLDTATMSQMLRRIYLAHAEKIDATILHRSARYSVLPAFSRAFPCR